MSACCLCLPTSAQEPQLRFSSEPKISSHFDPQAAAPASPARISLTLQEALDRARKNSVPFQAAVTTAGLAKEDRKQAFLHCFRRLPTTTRRSTQGTGPVVSQVTGSVVFIANNAVHEYISQADIHEAIDLAAIQNCKASAAAAVARAAGNCIARPGGDRGSEPLRGSAAQQKLEAAKTGGGENFEDHARSEHGGEVAHSDVTGRPGNGSQAPTAGSAACIVERALDLAVLIFRTSMTTMI